MAVRAQATMLLATIVLVAVIGVRAVAGIGGDLDGDNAINLLDVSLFNGCLAGPDGGSVDPECEAGDTNNDGDIDLRDFAAFQSRFGRVYCDPTWSDGSELSLETNANVLAMAVFDDGTGPALYVGGMLTTAGGIPASRIARWDGSAWSTLGDGLNGWVQALTTYDDGTEDALYAGGRFTRSGEEDVDYIAKWDGSSWSPLGAGLDAAEGIDTRVDSLAVFDDGGGQGEALYVGGTFTIAGGVAASRIARWDGTNWSALGAGVSGGVGDPNNPDSTVYAMTVYDDGLGGGPALYAGGRFTSAGDIDAERIARWDGMEWSALGLGMYNVYALTVFDDGLGEALHAGGAFDTAGGLPASKVALWDGVDWSPLGFGVNGLVKALTVYDDLSGPALYAAGQFTSAGGEPAKYIAKWDGTSWSPLGTGLSFAAEALQVYDDGTGPALYVGGVFTQAGGLPARYIAKWSRPPPPCP